MHLSMLKVIVPIAASVYLATAFIKEAAPSTCEGCVTATWSCKDKSPRPCKRENGIFEWKFDVQYSHVEDDCHELIPYNSSSLQIDADLYCSYPEAEWCRDLLCDKKFIGCDNMDRYTFSGLPLLPNCTGSDASQKLVTEDCKWVCKNGRPAARCTIHFDPYSQYGMRDDLDACWVKETCGAGGKTSTVKATCKRNVPVTEKFVAVKGEFTLSVADASTLMDSSPFRTALQEAIVESVADEYPGLKKDMVVIDSIMLLEERRLAATSFRQLAGRRLKDSLIVQYTITVTDHLASVVSNAILDNETRGELTLHLDKEMTDAGISGQNPSVEGVANTHNVMKISAELQRSNKELQALRQFKEVVTDHLEEAQEELTATRETLENATLTKNLTAKELQTLKAAHQDAQARLDRMMKNNDDLQTDLEEAALLHNQTHNALAEAQAAAAIANGNYIQALSRLSSAQNELAHAHFVNNETSDRLEQALQEHHMTGEELDKLDENHSETVKMLKALQANHTKALEKLHHTDVWARAAASAVESLLQERDATQQQLDKAEEANLETQGKLEAALEREKKLDADLVGVTASLTKLRADMLSMTDKYEMTNKALGIVSRDLLKAIEELKATRNELAQSKAELAAEREQHEDTKEALAEEKKGPDRNMLLIIAGALGASLIIAVCILCFIFRYRRKLACYCLARTMSEQSSDGAVVVGRPVGQPDGTAPDKGQNKEQGDTAKGVPASSPADNMSTPPQFAEATDTGAAASSSDATPAQNAQPSPNLAL